MSRLRRIDRQRGSHLSTSAAIVLSVVLAAGCAGATSGGSGQPGSTTAAPSPTLLPTTETTVAPSPTPTPTSAGSSVTPSASTASPSASLPAIPIATIAATIAVQHPFGIAASTDAVWVTSTAGVARIDMATNQVTMVQLSVSGNEIDGVAVTADGVWVSNFDLSTLYRIDPASMAVVAQIKTGANPEGVAATSGAIWVANHRAGTVSRIDPSTNQVVATVTVGPAGFGGPLSVAAGDGSIWVGVPNTNSVARIDPATNGVLATIPIPDPNGPCGGFQFTTDAVWIANCSPSTSISRINPQTNAPAGVVATGAELGDLVVDGSALWFTTQGLNGSLATLTRVDPATSRILAQVGLLPGVLGVRALIAGGSVWVVDRNGFGQVLRMPKSVLATP